MILKQQLRHLVSGCATLTIIALFVSGCKSQQQKSAEAVIEQLNQVALEINSLNSTNGEARKKYEIMYGAFKDSLESYTKNDAVKAESVEEIKVQLEAIRRNLDSITYVSVVNRMIGFYKGHGQTGTEIPNWGIVPSGVVLTEILIDKSNQTLYTASSPSFNREQTSFKIVDIEEKNDSTISGYFQNKANGAKFCSFEWTRAKLSLEGNLWKSDNTKQ
jgi:hypothetical protein